MAKKEVGIKNTTKFDASTYFEMIIDSAVKFMILTLVGIALIVTFAILYPLTNYNRYIVLIFIPGLMLALVGLIYFFLILRNYLSVREYPLTIEYEFFDKEVKEVSYRNNEVVEESVIEYDSFTKYRLKKKNIYLYLYNKRCVPVSKDENIDLILEKFDLQKIKKKIF